MAFGSVELTSDIKIEVREVGGEAEEEAVGEVGSAGDAERSMKMSYAEV